MQNDLTAAVLVFFFLRNGFMGRLIKYTNNMERKKKKEQKRKANENKRQRGALVALAGARNHVRQSKVAHKLVPGTWYIFGPSGLRD